MMPKYLIVYDAGYGEMADVIEADNQEEATECAYSEWQQAAESQAEYRAELATPENLENYGIDPEECPNTTPTIRGIEDEKA